jgi:polysaccharide biosynthesis protein PslH
LWRTLAICDRWAWPVRSGGEHRLAAMLEALNDLGDLEICVLPLISRGPLDGESRAATSAALHNAHVHEVSVAVRPQRRPAYLWSSRWPWWDPWRTIDYPSIRSSMKAALGRDRFDVVWVYSSLGGPLLDDWEASVRILDLPEILDLMHRQRGALRSPQRRLSALKWRYLAAVEAHGWRRVQKRACAQASLVTVCSEVDRETLECDGRVEVVPNGYRIPRRPVGRARATGPARTLVFQGTMDYFPNTDAAEFFVEQVLPLIRSRLPNAEFRVVGRAGATVRALSGREGLRVVGSVARIEDELEKADAVVVPLRIGSGSRLKILEAWAHGLPVVSTTVGAAGMPGSHDENLLLGDSAPDLAEACIRVLTDVGLRARLTEEGRRTVESSFDWSDIQARLMATIRSDLEASGPQRS